MTKKALVILLFLFTAISFENCFSNESFTRSDEDFFIELKEIFSGLDRRERQAKEEFVDSFAVVWRHSNFSDEQKNLVYETFDAMAGIRLRPVIDYPVYLKCIMALQNSRNARDNFITWHESFDGLITLRNQRRFVNYLNYSLNLFKDNIVYSSPTIKWQYDNDNYLLNFNSDTISVEFTGGNLTLYAQRDSIIIYNTDGVVYPFEERWRGNGGRITWERVDLDPDKVFAVFDSYSLSMRYSRFEVDSVEFYNTHFFDTPLTGRLSERIVADARPEAARYPSFQSYQAIHEIRDIFPDISYVGGFTMQGQRVLGSGTEESAAQVNFYNNDSLFITARSDAFSIRDDRISSARASVSIYYAGDSIHHPSIQMRYLEDNGEFYLLRDEKGISRAPFYNSYHSIDMFCEALYWYIGTTEILFQSIRGVSREGRAVFQSHDYFDDMLYMRLQGLSDVNPLFRLRNYARDNDTTSFEVADYARFIRSNVQSTKALLLSLSHQGFVFYDHVNEIFTITDKLYHYIGAVLGRSDYDDIRIESEASLNAKINMLNFDLHIEGVDRIPLSADKNVVLYPYASRIIMQKNRDIYFNGRIQSGLFDFFGKEFFFNYEEFKVDLVNTDSLSFRVRSFEPDSRGQHSLVRVRTVLEGINGELLIDHPDNKSGRLPIPRYPIFNSNNESFVYYDREYVQSGTYRRADVYFKLVPFTVDSLDHATTDNIAFDGVFISTGIFPEFTDYLTVQPDYSLGFNAHTPEEGYPIFGGKAHYYGPIDMSYEGLMANGKMEYLNSTIEADRMIMYLDSARADVGKFSIAQQLEPVEYPEVTATNVDMLFLPYDDVLSVSETDEPIELYAGLSTLRGSLSISPEGLTGSGKVNLFGSEIDSDFLAFNANSFDSPNADFKIFTLDGKNIAFHAFNYSGHFDMEVFKGELDRHTADARVSFPENRFDGYGYNFNWNMQEQYLNLENIAAPDPDEIADLSYSEIIDLDFSGHELVSTHRAQDSLRFFAGKIDFALEDNIIRAKEVDVIKVADAAIFPNNSKASVLLRAEIQRLENAKIVANTTNQFHYFYDVTAEVLTRNNYRARGRLDYIDELSEMQQIYFDEIRVNPENNSTFANGKIFEDQSFTLSPRFAFKGDVELKAEQEHLNFKGSSKIFTECEPMNINWFRFESVIDPENIVIPIAEDLRSDTNADIRTALVLAGDSFHIYPAFFSRQRHHLDQEISSASGSLIWDNISREYQVSTKERLNDRSLPDPFIRFNPATCMIESEGPVNIGSDFGQLKTKAYGTVTHQIEDFKTEYDIVLGLDFFFDDDALEYIAETIKERDHLRSINLNRQKYLKALRQESDEERMDEVRSEFLERGGLRRVPPELIHTMYFADIKLFWDQRTNSLVSENAIGVSSIDRTPLNKYVNGYLQIRKQRGGDVITFLLETISPGDKITEEEVVILDDDSEFIADLGIDTDDADDVDETDEDVADSGSVDSETETDKQEDGGSQPQTGRTPRSELLGPEFFYFSYSNSILQVIAANQEFNTIIRELNPRHRRMDVPRGESPFAFILSTERRPFDFVRVMQQIVN